MKTLFDLFLSFLKIGFFSFGGTTMIPVINDEVLVHGWMTADEVMDIVAVAEMTPGSLGINCATFVGLRTAGILGALSASLAVMMPSLTLCMLAAHFIMKLKGNQIDPYARIVAIADVYDAMTAARCYRGPLCPFRVIEMFEAEGFQKYDVSILLPFLENVVNSCLQNRCLLSDGRKGTIIYINKDKLSRPVVQCSGEYVNLADQPDLEIVRLL